MKSQAAQSLQGLIKPLKLMNGKSIGELISMESPKPEKKKPKTENNVIKIIKKEWAKEMERIQAKSLSDKSQGHVTKIDSKNLVQSGHAEIEANKTLFIFGNALEVLHRSEFYESVEEIHLEYVRFDLIVYHQNLEKLRKFVNLRKVYLSNNNLNSFILLSKLEQIPSLRHLIIEENEILKCQMLKIFLVYRFQHLQKFNHQELSD